MDKVIDSPTFQACLRLTQHLGPFSSNPKIDEAYRTLRLLGVPAQEASEMISDEIERRLTNIN